MLTVKQLVDSYQMQPHPEGGFYKEMYRSEQHFDVASAAGSVVRSASTAIYFLLQQGDFSAFHRIKSDECWHFYAGGTLLIHIIHLNGHLQTIHLGNQPHKGETFMAVVPAGAWFCSIPHPQSNYSFVGCTVAPGFDFEDFELAEKAVLLQAYPQHAPLIEQMCKL